MSRDRAVETPQGRHVQKRTTLAGELARAGAAISKSQAVLIWRRTAEPDLGRELGLSLDKPYKAVCPAGAGGLPSSTLEQSVRPSFIAP